MNDSSDPLEPMDMDTPSPEDEVMCTCSGTRRSVIQELFQQGMDMNAISRYTGAIAGCGGCEWDIAEFLNALARKHQRNSELRKAYIEICSKIKK